jgi:hypothetical protein
VIEIAGIGTSLLRVATCRSNNPILNPVESGIRLVIVRVAGDHRFDGIGRKQAVNPGPAGPVIPKRLVGEYDDAILADCVRLQVLLEPAELSIPPWCRSVNYSCIEALCNIKVYF